MIFVSICFNLFEKSGIQRWEQPTRIALTNGILPLPSPFVFPKLGVAPISIVHTFTFYCMNKRSVCLCVFLFIPSKCLQKP